MFVHYQKAIEQIKLLGSLRDLSCGYLEQDTIFLTTTAFIELDLLGPKYYQSNCQPLSGNSVTIRPIAQMQHQSMSGAVNSFATLFPKKR